MPIVVTVIYVHPLFRTKDERRATLALATLLRYVETLLGIGVGGTVDDANAKAPLLCIVVQLEE